MSIPPHVNKRETLNLLMQENVKTPKSNTFPGHQIEIHLGLAHLSPYQLIYEVSDMWITEYRIIKQLQCFDSLNTLILSLSL